MSGTASTLEVGAARRPKRARDRRRGAARSSRSGAPTCSARRRMLRLQREAGNGAVSELRRGAALAGARRRLVGRRSPLEPTCAPTWSRRLGHDFGDVRVHTDAAAHDSAQSVGAHAYTVGSNVVFQRDAYDPSSHGRPHDARARADARGAAALGPGRRHAHGRRRAASATRATASSGPRPTTRRGSMSEPARRAAAGGARGGGVRAGHVRAARGRRGRRRKRPAEPRAVGAAADQRRDPGRTATLNRRAARATRQRCRHGAGHRAAMTDALAAGGSVPAAGAASGPGGALLALQREAGQLRRQRPARREGCAGPATRPSSRSMAPSSSCGATSPTSSASSAVSSRPRRPASRSISRGRSRRPRRSRSR